jgi:hypothetical protein
MSTSLADRPNKAIQKTAPHLEKCPNEIIEAIVVLLDFKDIGNLRRTSQKLSVKATQTHFKSFFSSNRIELKPRNLERLVEITGPGQIGGNLRNLTLVGVPERHRHGWSRIHTSASTAKQNLHLLSRAFNNLAVNENNEEDFTIVLEVQVPDCEARELTDSYSEARDNWENVWKCAAETFHTTMLALSASPLPLEKLVAYHDPSRSSVKMACNELDKVDFRNESLAVSLSTLKSLQIGLSDRIIRDLSPHIPASGGDVRPEEVLRVTEQAMAKSNFTGLPKFLELAPSLESLEIHYYRLENAHEFLVRQPHLPHQELLRYVVGSEYLPRLKHCGLCGVIARSEDLVSFVQRTAPHTLVMENVLLSSGTFRPFFDYCTSDDTNLNEIHFLDLAEGEYQRNTVEFLHVDSPSDGDLSDLVLPNLHGPPLPVDTADPASIVYNHEYLRSIAIQHHLVSIADATYRATLHRTNTQVKGSIAYKQRSPPSTFRNYVTRERRYKYGPTLHT